MSDTVLVTGAAGFIGHHVVRLLRAEGRQVRALIRPGEDTRNLDELAAADPAAGAGIERVVGDILDRPALARHMAGCSVVYHLAAVYRTWVPDPKVIYDVNVTGAANVLATAAALGVRRVIHTSSIAAIGLDPAGQPAGEDTAFNLWAHAFDYVRSKYLAHQVALAFAPVLDVVLVCPGMPLGPGDIGPTPTGKTLVDTLNGKIRVSFEGGLTLVDVEDVARGHLLAEAHGRRGEAYLLTGHNLTIFEMIGELRKVVGMRHGMLRVPAGLAAMFGGLLESWAENVSRREPMITPGAVAYASQRLFYDNRKAREELGFTVRPLAETLRRSVQWFIDHGHVRAAAAPAIAGVDPGAAA
ncbi:MAG: NAD-dependent epimerase/dehydratase family protein [Myxococcales bacterium]|nr:NAD-dependent epimerase/dehydratase family protein [Myxococcales bacterium]